jgi:hypothetical protein
MAAPSVFANSFTMSNMNFAWAALSLQQQLSSNDPKWITDTDANLVHLLEEFIPAIQTHIDRQTNRVHLHAADQTPHYDSIIPTV